MCVRDSPHTEGGGKPGGRVAADMRTYAEALAAARDRSPFSNGTEGYGWMDAWCDSCIHDRGVRDGSDETGCPLVMVALMQKTPSEWLDGPRDEQGRYSIEGQYHCVEFRVEDDDPGPGCEPVEPVSPDQMELFDAEPWRRPRMFADVVAQLVEVR